MKLKVMRHLGPSRTAREMKRSAEHWKDLGVLASWDLESFFDYVRKIRYIDDPNILKNGEIVARPKYLLSVPALDCKKKAVLMASWANANKKPYKFIAVSDRSDGELHHVFTIIKDGSTWLVADPTYRSYFLGEPKVGLTKIKVL